MGAKILSSSQRLHRFLLSTRSPVRQCNTPLDDGDKETTAGQSYLYKATTRSLFLQRIETVFDPKTEVTRYSGYFKPLCNFIVRDNIYLYVHPEKVYDKTLRESLPLKKEKSEEEEEDTATPQAKRDKWDDEEDEFFGHKK